MTSLLAACVHRQGSLGCEFFYVGPCVSRKWVVRGGGFDGFFGEHRLTVGFQECLERFHRGFFDYLNRQFVPKLDSPSCEGELVKARTSSLLVELVDVAA